MSQRDQLAKDITSLKKVLKTQRKKFALARKNLGITQRAIARTRAKKGALTAKESQGLNDALKTSYEEVSALYEAILAMESDLKSFDASLTRLPP